MAKNTAMARIPKEIHDAVVAIKEQRGITFAEAMLIWQQQAALPNETDRRNNVSNTETENHANHQQNQTDMELYGVRSQSLQGVQAPLEVTHRIVDERQNNRLDRLEEFTAFLAGEVSVNRSGIHTMNAQLGSGEEYDPAQTLDVMQETRQKLLAKGHKRLAGYLEDAPEQVEAEEVEDD